MKSLKLAFRVALALVLFVTTFDTANASGGSGTQTIGSIVVDVSADVVMIVGSSAWNNPDGCAVSTIVAISMSNTHYNDILAAALMASATGKSAAFYISGCVSTSWGTAPQILTIQTY
jgi:hypothetical protein